MVVPLVVAAAIAAFATRLPRRVVAPVALATATMATAVTTVLLFQTFGHHVVYWFSGWRPHHGIAIGIDFAVDSMGAGLAALVSLLVTAALAFSQPYFEDTVAHRYTILMLTFLAAMVAFCLTGDLFDMFVFFELLSVSAYALTAYQIQQPGPLEGALNFAVTNTLGGVCILLGVGLVYGVTGALNLAQIGHALAGRGSDGLVVAGFALLVVGFFVKAAVVPFHFWLADAYAAAPVPVCVVFSGVMSELGLFAVARLYWSTFEGALGPHQPWLRVVLLGLGTATALISAVMAFSQQHLKRLLAFATVSNVGLGLIGIALFEQVGLAGAALYTVADGMGRAALFFLVGILILRFGTVDEEDLRGRGRARSMLGAGALFAVGGLALAEMPPFGTSVGKTLIEDAASRMGYHWVPVVFGVSAALIGGAVLRAAGRVFLGWGPREPDRFGADRAAEEPEGEERARGPRTVPPLLLVPTVLLLAMVLVLGLIPGLSGRIEHAAAEFQDRTGYAAAVLHGRAALLPSIRVEPPSAQGTIYGLASAAAAIGVAVVALLRRRLLSPAVRGAVRSAAIPPLRQLRALHSGHLGDYAAWFTVGLVTVAGLFALGAGR